MNRSLAKEDPELTDDHVQEMLHLAERLRAARGGELDDAALQAVAEATDAPIEYVRLALRMQEKRRTQSSFGSLRSAILEIDPDTRRNVLSALVGTFWALFATLAKVNAQSAGFDFYNTLALIATGLGLWNVAMSRSARAGAIAGGVLGGTFFVTQGLFAYVGNVTVSLHSALLPVFLALGSAIGFALFQVVDRYRSKLGMSDPVKERQELLRQLMSLQEKLRSGEQSITFASVDIVGSTQMKAEADALSVEFTFNEYHQFVAATAARYGGRVHSTAGDGVILAFDHPQSAFAASKNLQAGIIELNTFRNKIGTPIQLRIGIHTGTVVAPQAGDIKSVNFAHVIDMAAHIQKASPPGGIAVSEPSAELLTGGYRSVGSERLEVLGTGCYLWQPRTSLNRLPGVPAAIETTMESPSPDAPLNPSVKE